ncbi:MAG: cytochrome b/b6 domain-containing protein [Puia sp.]|nr:cytochrome b/b6 domain-containing protein [Puia sp.]
MSSIDSSPVAFNETHSPAIRIWHWTFFIVLTASLTTVFFGSTLFKTRDNIGFVQTQLQDKGVTLSKDQARAVAHGFSDKLWDLHTWIGYVLCGLLLSRFIIEIAQPGEEKLRHRMRNALGYRPDDAGGKADRKHYILVKSTYLAFYTLFTVMALTGLGLAFEDTPPFKQWHRTLGQIHSFVQYFIYAFILLHLVGVVRADLGKRRGIVSGMIHGKKRY